MKIYPYSQQISDKTETLKIPVFPENPRLFRFAQKIISDKLVTIFAKNIFLQIQMNDFTLCFICFKMRKLLILLQKPAVHKYMRF